MRQCITSYAHRITWVQTTVRIILDTHRGMVGRQYLEIVEAYVILQKLLSDLRIVSNNLRKKLDMQPSWELYKVLLLTSDTLERSGKIIRKRKDYLEYLLQA